MSTAVVWIGVRPDSLRVEDALNGAGDILGIPESSDIHDVGVEFKETIHRRSDGPPTSCHRFFG